MGLPVLPWDHSGPILLREINIEGIFFLVEGWNHLNLTFIDETTHTKKIHELENGKYSAISKINDIWKEQKL